jgi:CRP-like cAMP-binding protein
MRPPAPPASRTPDFLRNLPLFRELGDAELARIAAATGQVRVRAGTVLFRRGDLPAGFHVVVYGQVKLSVGAPDGDEKVIEVIGPGMSFGEAVMLLERPHVVTAEALADSLLLAVGRQAVFAELDRDPALARRMLAGLSVRLHRLVSDLEALSLQSATQRVIGYLLRDVPVGTPAGAPTEVRLATAKGVIASRLNITREHFSRILHDLSAAGLIAVTGRTVRILDPGRLRAHGAQ